MVGSTTQTITVDRMSNSGNAIAQQQHAGKTIHVPAGKVGETYDVSLVDKGGYFVAKLVDRASEAMPRQPGIGPDTSDIGEDLIDSSGNKPHSFSVRSCPKDGKLRSTPSTASGAAVLQSLSRQKI